MAGFRVRQGGWGIVFGGHSAASTATQRAQAVATAFHTTTQLQDVPIAADWSGPIDRSADGLPLIGHLGGRANILYAVGWSGERRRPVPARR